jgi:hypothetical protein
MSPVTDTIAWYARPWRRRSAIRSMTAAGVIALAVFVAMPVVSADRLNDKAVKELIDRIDDERDRFEDQLDGELKRSIIRGPRGEVNVERYLDDLQENVDKLKERFKSDYAGSAEVTTVLRQGRTSSATCQPCRQTSTARANGTVWLRASANWLLSTALHCHSPRDRMRVG